jgi:hypothetical protein
MHSVVVLDLRRERDYDCLMGNQRTLRSEAGAEAADVG